MKGLKFDKLEGIIITIFIICSFMFFFLKKIETEDRLYYYFILAPILFVFLILLTLEIINKSRIKHNYIDKQIIINKQKNQLTTNQNHQFFEFLKKWFNYSTEEDIQNLISLKLSLIKGELKLLKDVKSFSLLLFKLIDKGYYTKEEGEYIYNCSKIKSSKDAIIDKEVFIKHYSEFSQGKSIDKNKQNDNINLLLESLKRLN